MEIPVKVQKKQFYQLALKALQALPPFNNLRAREMEVYGWLLYYYWEYKAKYKDEELVNKLLFSYDTRIAVCEEMGIEVTNFYTLMLSLRKNNIITKDSLIKKYILSESKHNEICYKFSIQQ
jgi:hypothetical protein